MEEKKIIQLKQGLTTAFINYSHASNLAYKPQFISNNYKEGRKVISSVEDELLNCEEFAISVAFITMGGVVLRHFFRHCGSWNIVESGERYSQQTI